MSTTIFYLSEAECLTPVSASPTPDTNELITASTALYSSGGMYAQMEQRYLPVNFVPAFLCIAPQSGNCRPLPAKHVLKSQCHSGSGGRKSKSHLQTCLHSTKIYRGCLPSLSGTRKALHISQAKNVIWVVLAWKEEWQTERKSDWDKLPGTA